MKPTEEYEQNDDRYDIFKQEDDNGHCLCRNGTIVGELLTDDITVQRPSHKHRNEKSAYR